MVSIIFWFKWKIWQEMQSISEEKVFKIDMKKPEIYISGIKNNKSYKTFVNVKLHVKMKIWMKSRQEFI